MWKKLVPFFVALCALAAAAGAAELQGKLETKPGDVAEIAPGVYFRHGNLIENGHCNNGFVLFRDFVLAIDANFPSGAEACLEAIQKVTDKPVRFVFATHHHGDHLYGNPVWLRIGATPISCQGTVDEMGRYEPDRWRSAKRPDMTALGLDAPPPPIVAYPDRMVIDDGAQRVELLHFGTAHTRGDGFAYLPKHKVLFTGDVVINGPFNYMGDGDTASWIGAIDSLKRLDVEIVAGGHGPAAGRDLLDRQRKFIVELRTAVAGGIAAGKTTEDIARTIGLSEDVRSFAGEWLPDQVAKIYREMMGFEMPLELVRMGLAEGPSPAKGDPGWSPPAKLVLAERGEWLGRLEKVAPGVRIVVPETREKLVEEVADADGLIGGLDLKVFGAARRLRWYQSLDDGVENCLGVGEGVPGLPNIVESPIVITDVRRCSGPAAADQVFSCLLAFTRKTKTAIEARAQAAPAGGGRRKAIEPSVPDPQEELQGRTLVLVGAEGIGPEVGRRAEAFGMTAIAVDPRLQDTPRGFAEVRRLADLPALLPRADVLVAACPLTGETRGLIGKAQLEALKAGAYLIDVSRGGVVDRVALLDALRSGKLAGAGLDVTDPEPLPDGDPFWSLPNVILTARSAGRSEESRRRAFLLVRENLRRFAAGERLLNVVDKKTGY